MHVFLVLALVACAHATLYPDSTPSAEKCKNTGDILRNPKDRCSYLECHPGDEPWFDDYGRLQLFVRVRKCPPGTAVPEKGHHGDVIFKPILYDPTYRVGSKARRRGYGGLDQGYGGLDQGYGGRDRGYGGRDRGYGGRDRGYGGRDRGYGGYEKPTYKYKNSYQDMTAICSERVDYDVCSKPKARYEW